MFLSHFNNPTPSVLHLTKGTHKPVKDSHPKTCNTKPFAQTLSLSQEALVDPNEGKKPFRTFLSNAGSF